MSRAVILDGDADTAMQVQIPKGWSVGKTPNGELIVRNPAVGTSFHTNVVIGCDTVSAEIDLATVAAHALDHLERRYGPNEVRGEVVVSMGLATGVVRLVLFDAGIEQVRLAQFHGFADGGLDRSGSSRLVFQIVATCRAEDLARCGDDIAFMLGSAEVSGSPARLTRRSLHRAFPVESSVRCRRSTPGEVEALRIGWLRRRHGIGRRSSRTLRR
jgi:hypothetical protein